MSTDNTELSDIHSDCGASEPYALQVTDDSMHPEFEKDCIVIIDPIKHCKNGQFVFVEYEGVRWFRQYIEKDNHKYLIALNSLYPEIILDNSFDIIGIIIQKNNNRKITHYK
tara:strand:- start:5988 stop:6323 length:336 start_codon:yes stop_codon:yes gene_type:complete